MIRAALNRIEAALGSKAVSAIATGYLIGRLNLSIDVGIAALIISVRLLDWGDRRSLIKADPRNA